MLDLKQLTPKQKRQCSRCGSSWEHPDIINCKRCKERELERARRRNDEAEKAAKLNRARRRNDEAEKAAKLNRARKNEEWQATHCYVCGVLRDEPNPKCSRCRERARRRKKWILHRDKVMKPRDMYNMEATKAWIRARRYRLNQDPNAPFEGIDY